MQKNKFFIALPIIRGQHAPLHFLRDKDYKIPRRSQVTGKKMTTITAIHYRPLLGTRPFVAIRRRGRDALVERRYHPTGASAKRLVRCISRAANSFDFVTVYGVDGEITLTRKRNA